jgi:hypothetical protein
MMKYLGATLFIILAATMLLGCLGVQQGSQAQPTAGNVNFRLMISDEPNEITNFYSLNVTITKIGWEKDGDSDNWTVEPPTSVDLTQLGGDKATEIWNGHLVSGNYTKVFIYTENTTGVLYNADRTGPGSNATVKLPSGTLQISKPFTISEEDGSSLVNFVFDVTVIRAGGSGKYILKPQIGESGPNKPFNEVTPHGAKEGKNETEKSAENEQLRLVGVITKIVNDNSFEMQVDSTTWTVDYAAAKKITGVPDNGITKGLSVMVQGTTTGTTSIGATVVQIKGSKK